MSVPHLEEVIGREHAMQLDAKDPLKSFRKEFLIPTKTGSSMSLPYIDPAQHTYWQLQTATMAMTLAFTFAETP